ncbi:uncharacterized protein CMC5_061070 [Chondromyces crocatus]|uniref:P/Homo B domain-containing protein n=2 Tax=Chondromyces crocatus TaxID=52 RepID=A0A0K1EM44_CHOCO|nr:uncharacterized protein CMC5_061070 [Chondromyces crocatus]
MSALSCTLDVMGTGPDAADPDGNGGTGAGSAGSAGEGGGDAGGGGPGTGGEGGSGEPVPRCGDGAIDAGERCDDGNGVSGDGCSACGVDDGYTCSGAPSVCEEATLTPFTEGPRLGISIPDDARYDGSLASMVCVPIAVTTASDALVRQVELSVGIQHPYLGDLVIKVASPDETVLTVMSRPGVNDPEDSSFGSNGDSSNLEAAHPIRFADGEARSAQTMGSSIGGGSVVCKDDNRCDYAPAPERGPGTAFSDFHGKPATGSWRVCVADGDTNDSGSIDMVSLSILAW